MNTNTDLRDACFQTLFELAKHDHRILLLSGDMTAFVAKQFQDELPKQYYNVGIQEQHLMSMAAGMAAEGLRPFVYSIIPFVTFRCFEQIKIDIAGHRLPVVIIGVGPGYTYNVEGPTHHAIQDIGVMRMIPELTIYNPADSISTEACLRAAYENNQPTYYRLEKGQWPALSYIYSEGGFNILRRGTPMIITTGIMVHQAMALAEKLNLGVAFVHRLQPLNVPYLLYYCETPHLIILEEHDQVGGLGSIIAESLLQTSSDLDGQPYQCLHLALPHQQAHQFGSREWLWQQQGLDLGTLEKTISTWKEKIQEGKKT